MGYPETMRDIMEEVRRKGIRRKRKELANSTRIDHEHDEALVASANDSPSQGKQESNGK